MSEEAARIYDGIADELDMAAAHARRTAEHFRDGGAARDHAARSRQ
jgi:hypothetical protein